MIVVVGAEHKLQRTAWEKMEIFMTENVVIVDRTSTIRATFWGDEFAKELKEEVKYDFTEMKVDAWKKEYKLYGSKKTSHTIAKDEATDMWPWRKQNQ